MTDTPQLDTFLVAQRMADEFDGYSAGEIERMPMSDYARIRERAGLDPVDPFASAYSQYESEHQAPEQPPAPLQEPQSAPEDITNEQFLAWRQNRVSGGEGRGVFDSVGSQSDEFTSAVRRQAGRGALSNANVEDAPRIGRVFIQDSPVTGRTMGYR